MPTHKKKKHRQSTTMTNVANREAAIETAEKSQSNKAFTVRTSEVMGRYIVASKPLKAGELIISEYPLVVGPCTTVKVQCLGCYKVLEKGQFSKCKQCGWPLCKPDCKGLGKHYGHTQEECLILRESKSSRLLNFNDFTDLSLHLHAIAPLRCLLLKRVHPELHNVLMTMESHNAIRKKNSDIWESNQTFIVDRIRKDWGLNMYSEDEIHTICGILEVNAFELGIQGVSIRGLYPTAFLMSHDCVPNTNHTDEDDFKLCVRASTDILTNKPITLSYSYTLQGTLLRRKHILENKFFECKCRRCTDPTELGTFMSALQCPKCKTGNILQKEPLDPESEWTCNKCFNYTISTKSMETLIEKIQKEIDLLNCNNISGMEILLEKYRNVLHPTHYLCVRLKISLSQLYGKIDNYIINELSKESLERKAQLCKELMKIFDVIEPGLTRVRGITLYELHAPLMIIATRRFQEGTITKLDLRRELKKILCYLKEAALILENEPKHSSEYLMATAAKEALERIKGWQTIIGKF